MRFFQLQFYDKKEFQLSYVYLPIPNNRLSLSRDHQTVAIMNNCCYCFDGLWKVNGKYIQYAILYIVLCLNALIKLQNARGASCYPAWMDNCPTCSHMPWPYQSTKWFVISPLQAVFKVWDSMATREVPPEKNVDMKCTQVNVLKNISRMTRFLLCYIRVLEWIYTL